MQRSSKIKVGILGGTNFISVLVNTILFPLFPQMSRALNIGLQEFAILVGIVSFPAAILNLMGGILGDRFGKKLVIVLSLFMYGLGGLVIAIAVFLLTDPYPVMLVGRFMQGVGSATPMYLTVALIGDIFNSIERSKALGFLETANGLGKVSSPMIGAVIGLITWYAIFFIYPVLAFPLAILTWRFIDEPEKTDHVDWNKQKKAFFMFKDYSRILTLIVSISAIFILIGTMFWLGDYLEARLEMNQLLRGAVISLPAVSMLITTLFAGEIAKNINPRLVMGGGLILMALAAGSLIFTLETIMFWVAIVLIGMGAGLVLPVIDTVSTTVKQNIRGVVSTIYGSSRSLGGAIAPITFSYLLDLGLRVTFWTVAGIGLVFGLLVIMSLKEQDIVPSRLLPRNN